MLIFSLSLPHHSLKTMALKRNTYQRKTSWNAPYTFFGKEKDTEYGNFCNRFTQCSLILKSTSLFIIIFVFNTFGCRAQCELNNFYSVHIRFINCSITIDKNECFYTDSDTSYSIKTNKLDSLKLKDLQNYIAINIDSLHRKSIPYVIDLDKSFFVNREHVWTDSMIYRSGGFLSSGGSSSLGISLYKNRSFLNAISVNVTNQRYALILIYRVIDLFPEIQLDNGYFFRLFLWDKKYLLRTVK